MAWFPIQYAAAALGVSDRTLRRRIRAGMYTHRRVGRMILVELDLSSINDRLADVGEDFAEASKANAITTRTSKSEGE